MMIDPLPIASRLPINTMVARQLPTNAYVCSHACSHACTHTHTLAHIHTLKHKHIHVCTCMYIYTHSLTYANILTIIDVYRSGQTKLKPVVIDDYNQHMLGVDKLDQFASYYSFLHKSVKWWRKIFWMLEVAVINSYIIYKKLATSRGRRPMTHKAFRRVLIDHLSAPLRSQGHQRTTRRPPPAQNLERLQNVRHFQEKGRKRKDCWVCSDRTPGGTRHLTFFQCATCSTKPTLCPSPCFELYHTQRNLPS